MLLGKRQRPPMRRTTSMSEFAADLEVSKDSSRPSDREIPAIIPVSQHLSPARHQRDEGKWTAEWRPNTVSAVVSMISPRAPRRGPADFMAVDTAPFLRSCALCNRRLAPGRDIFMYRGEIAFCSLECRQQQMNQDEKKEKCSRSSIKNSAPATAGGTSASSGNGKSVVAA